MDSFGYFRAGQLDEAIQAATAEVKEAPSKSEPRDLLVQLLCYAGQFERAETHLRTLEAQFPDRAKTVTLIQNLIAAAQVRQQVFHSGWLPQFLDDPPDYLKLHLEALMEIREGRLEKAKELLDQAEEERPAATGKSGSLHFDDMRDFDDVTSSFLEVLTSEGTYYWIPFEQIMRIALLQMDSPLDLLWRPARMNVTEELQGIVYIPQLYVDSATSSDGEIQLGKATEWIAEDGQPVRGLGHRVLWMGGEARPLADTTEITFRSRQESESTPS